jgi:Matrixin
MWVTGGDGSLSILYHNEVQLWGRFNMPDDTKAARDGESGLLQLLMGRGYKQGAPRSRSAAGRWRVRAAASTTFGLGVEIEDAGPIIAFQQFYGLDETGEFDAETLGVLLHPRCGVPDPVGPRALRSGTGGWPTTALTFAFENELEEFEPDRVRAVMLTAFDTWSNVSSLHFNEVAEGANISIRFGPQEHGDDFPFDSTELAHAFFPDHRPKSLAGQVHFDTSEDWSIDEFCPEDAKDLLSVAIHEIGHAIGLDHVGIRRSVMFANYQGMQRSLYPFDIETINSVYS